MLASGFHSRRWLLLAAVGFAALALHLVQRPAPPAEPEFICVVPDIELAQRPAAQPSPKPSPLSDRHMVVADLISRGSAMPDCGSFVLETTMVFTDINADSATLRVLVPCAEMSRPMYSSNAGDAPMLR